MGIFIIAEAGVNHNGSMELAYELIDKAKEAGCDCVKFQTFRTEKLVTRTAPKAEYQLKNTGKDDSQFEMLKSLEFTYGQFEQLKKYCEDRQIEFLSTPFDEESSDMLEKLGVSKFKLSSGDITNKPFLRHIAAKQKPILLSTGMCDLRDVEQAVFWIEACGNRRITILHCTSNYPTPPDEVNMRAMDTLKACFGYPTGYSDHTEGIAIPIMAAARGACVIEKHFTLDKNMEGPDHKASLNPAELSEMVASIRKIEQAMGDGRKAPTPSEMNTRKAARKSIVWKADYQEGLTISEDMFCMKRPGTGIAPEYADTMVNQKLAADVKKDELVKWKDVRMR